MDNAGESIVCIRDSVSNEINLIKTHHGCDGLTEPVEPIEILGRIYTNSAMWFVLSMQNRTETEEEREH